MFSRGNIAEGLRYFVTGMIGTSFSVMDFATGVLNLIGAICGAVVSVYGLYRILKKK